MLIPSHENIENRGEFFCWIFYKCGCKRPAMRKFWKNFWFANCGYRRQPGDFFALSLCQFFCPLPELHSFSLPINHPLPTSTVLHLFDQLTNYPAPVLTVWVQNHKSICDNVNSWKTVGNQAELHLNKGCKNGFQSIFAKRLVRGFIKQTIFPATVDPKKTFSDTTQ